MERPDQGLARGWPVAQTPLVFLVQLGRPHLRFCFCFLHPERSRAASSGRRARPRRPFSRPHRPRRSLLPPPSVPPQNGSKMEGAKSATRAPHARTVSIQPRILVLRFGEFGGPHPTVCLWGDPVLQKTEPSALLCPSNYLPNM